MIADGGLHVAGNNITMQVDPGERLPVRARTGSDVRRVVSHVLGVGVLVVAVAGCRTTSDVPPEPPAEMSCDDPVVHDLGVPTVRRPARFTTSGGRLRFVVSALPSGSILGDIDDTEVQLSDADAPTEAELRVTASPQQPGVIEVEAGTYSVLNTNRGAIQVEACRDVTLSDVVPGTPEAGTGPGS